MTEPEAAPAAQPPLNTVMKCPRCQQLTAHYCTINDQWPFCPPCAEAVRLELTTLTTERFVKGVAAGLVTALVVCVGANAILAAIGEKSGAGIVQGLAAVFMGTVVGRAARKQSQAGGLALQLATVFIAVVAVLEMNAGLIYANGVAHGESHVVALLKGVVGSPIIYVLMIFMEFSKHGLWLLFWLFWAIYDPWRATAPLQLRLDGPFPVVATNAPPPPANGPGPAGPNDARAAGLDFERPR